MSLPAQFRNQRVHGILNWRLAMPYLQSAAASELDPMASPSPSSRGQWPEWDEARREGCESPLELRLLRAMRTTGLPEPVKQHEVYDSRGRPPRARRAPPPDRPDRPARWRCPAGT